MWSFLKPPAYKAELPQQEVDASYKRLRWQVFVGILLGMPVFTLCVKTFLWRYRNWHSSDSRRAN